MASDLPPEPLLAKYPELAEVGAALDDFRAGRRITARCSVCGAGLTVTEVPATGELWVTCPNGHVRFRARREIPLTPPDR
jgi:hypothetical protein